MHPLLARARNLGIYLLAWFPLGAMLAYLLKTSGGLDWVEAVTLSSPLCLVYAFVCLAAWYPCRVTPLEASGFPRLAATHLLAAVLVSTLWAGMARAVAAGLAKQGFQNLDVRLAQHLSLLWITGISALPVVGNISLRATGGAELTRGAGTSLGGTGPGSRC